MNTGLPHKMELSFEQKCRQLGLDPDVIARHYQRILTTLQQEKFPTIPIFDTCRIDNQAIMTFSDFEALFSKNELQKFFPRIASFVPAAGAASRYIKPFENLIRSLKSNDRESIKHEWDLLKSQGVGNWALPKETHRYLKNLDQPNELTEQQRQQIISTLQYPKALFPVQKDAESFLEHKIKEATHLGLNIKQYFVFNSQQMPIIRQHLSHRKDHDIQLLEQGPQLCTIRFCENGQPFVEKTTGTYSLVPAGHGSLQHLMKDIANQNKECHALLIRNIDNVVPLTKRSLAAQNQFLNLYEIILNRLKKIRQNINTKDWANAATLAREFLQLVTQSFGKNITEAHLNDPLWGLLQTLFGVDSKIAELVYPHEDEKNWLKALYNRPFNLLGQVRNLQHHVGGTPVISQMNGVTFRICLEAAHAHPSDKAKFLEDFSRATHFNPVFVLAEIPFSTTQYTNEHLAPWLIAKKSYQGQIVYYHETALYELLGCNLLANCLYIEIPNELFHPHKTLTT